MGVEDFPYANLEALILGKPILGQEVAGIPAPVAHGLSGLLVPPKEAETLPQAIASLV